MMRAAEYLSGRPTETLYDFTTRLGRPPQEFDRNTRSRLMVALLRDETTRSGALVRGFKYAPRAEEIALWDRYDFDFIQRMSPQTAKSYKPLTRPWWPEPEVPVMTTKLRERLKEHARKTLGG